MTTRRLEYRTGDGKVRIVYQLLDDATRFDAGSWAYRHHEYSHDAHNAPPNGQSIGMGGHINNSKAYNQLRQGRMGAVENFLASKDTMPVTGIPLRPTTRGTNDRSHETLQRFFGRQRTSESVSTAQAHLCRPRV